MELLEIKGLFEIDYGAPSPLVMSNDNELFVSFYVDQEGATSIPQVRNTVYDTGICVLRFKSFAKYTFGMPGNENIEGHPYSKLGLRSNSFYQMKHSDWIVELESIAKSHEYYKPEKWLDYNHYILTFHDTMFECIAKEFEIQEQNTSLYSQASSILSQLSLRDI